MKKRGPKNTVLPDKNGFTHATTTSACSEMPSHGEHCQVIVGRRMLVLVKTPRIRSARSVNGMDQ